MPRSNTPPAGPRSGGLPQGGVCVAVVDGVPLFREGLSSLIRRTPGLRWAGAADAPQGAVQLVERFHPRVLLVDSGVDPRHHLGHALTAGHPEVHVMIVVRDRHRTTHYVATALASGVHGVILRTAEPGQYLEAIVALHRERRYVDPALAPTVAAPLGRPAWVPDSIQPLSRREFQVLQLIADGLENQAIAKILFVSVETVRTHVKSILRKLSARDRTHAVAVAFRSGVLTVAPRNQAPRTGT